MVVVVVVYHKRRMVREITMMRVVGDREIPATIAGGGCGGGRGRRVEERAWKGEEEYIGRKNVGSLLSFD